MAPVSNAVATGGSFCWSIHDVFLQPVQVLCGDVKWFTEFGHLNRGDMLTSEKHRCTNEKKKL